MMDPSPRPTTHVPTQRVDALLAEGNIAEALENITEVVDQCRLGHDGDPEILTALADALEARADLLMQNGDHAAALDDYQESLELLPPASTSLKQLGRLRCGLGLAFEALGDLGRAAEYWEHAIQCFEENDPPSLIAAATLANNLAHLKKDAGDFDGAETAFLKALEIFHTHCGPDHEQTATVATNLGSLYQVVGYYESARDMHTLAMEACRKRLGETHEETGQAYHNLAIAHAGTGDLGSARRFFESALDVFEALGPAHHDSLADVGENFRTLLIDDGDTAMAESVSRRVLNSPCAR